MFLRKDQNQCIRTTLFYSVHSSFLSPSGAYITYNATWPLTVWSENWPCIINVLSVSQLQFSLEPEPVAINCTAFNHNGNLLVTGAADGVIRLFGQWTQLTTFIIDSSEGLRSLSDTERDFDSCPIPLLQK